MLKYKSGQTVEVGDNVLISKRWANETNNGSREAVIVRIHDLITVQLESTKSKISVPKQWSLTFVSRKTSFQAKTEVSRDAHLVYFTFNTGTTNYCCSIDKWKIYKIIEELHLKYKVPLELIDELQELTQDELRSDMAYDVE